jgi:predicted dehydrogenase/threonine dehydrogenase-like Zn-dependent dehydrogenase
MKQLIQDVRTGTTSVVDAPIPRPGPGMVLVRTAASAVSTGTERALVEFAGMSLVAKARSRPDLVRQTVDKARREGVLSTLEAVQNRLDQPMPLGYSSAGTVVEVGPDVDGVRPGDRVACAGGGYAVHAEYAVVPQNLIAPLPAGVDFEPAAFATLGAIALHGFRLAEPQIGERIAVIGLGLLGLLAAQVARAAGCTVFGTDIAQERVTRARGLGLEAALRSEAEASAASLTGGLGFDAVLICAHADASDPVELAGAIARDRARVISIGVVGLELPRRVYFEKELRFIVSRSYGPGRYDTHYEEGGHDYPIGFVRWTEGRNLAAFCELLAAGRVDVASLITHRIPIERGADAYSLITAESAEPFLGVVITYPETPSAPGRRAIPIVTPGAEPSSPVRLGALGAGSFATGVLFPALRKIDAIDLVCLASATGFKSAEVARRFGFHSASTDEAEVLRDDRVNTIAVLTRHHLHARQTAAALRAGKHVFCEKPLALSREDLLQVEEALRASARLLLVGFNRRFAPMSARLREFLEPVHEPLSIYYRVNAGLLPPGHWHYDPSQGGGRIVSEACHFIDYLTFLTGALPVLVLARALPGGGRYREENVVLTVELADGSIGVIHYLANGGRSMPKERVEVFGGGRSAALDDFRRLELFSADRRVTLRAPLRQDKGHRREWEAFASAIRSGGPPPIPYDEIFAVSLATLAAQESLRQGTPLRIEPLRIPE